MRRANVLLVTTVVAILLACSGCGFRTGSTADRAAVARESDFGGEQVDQEADRALRAMGRTLANADRFTVEATVEVDEVLESGELVRTIKWE